MAFEFLRSLGTWFLIGLSVLALLVLGFWIWSLVDCIKMKKFKNKTFWILVLVLLNFIGSILYVILIKRKKQY